MLTDGQHVPVVLEGGRRRAECPADAHGRLLVDADDWPSNVRELENVIQRVLILSAGSTLQLEEPLAVAARPAADRLEDVERAHIVRVLERCGWRIHGSGNAAAVLGLQPSTLRSRIQKLGIRRPGRPSQTAR